jgi:ribosomal protein L18E
MVSDFYQKQIEASERLYQMMMDDHNERMKVLVDAYDLSASLVKKLEERDAEIARLRAMLRSYKILETM